MPHKLQITMLKNKVVVITGASSGIGYATALRLSKSKMKIAVGARRTKKLEKLKNKIIENGSEAISQELDVSKKQSCGSFVQNVIKKWDHIDFLINNAGIMPLSFIKNLQVDEWDKMIDVNLKGTLYCTRFVIPYMLKQKSGHIINISSVAGKIIFPAGSVYCATKHAINAFSEGLRQEFSNKYSIRVTVIEPGLVNTELTNTITDDSLQSFVENSKKLISLKAEDIANTIMFAMKCPEYVNVNELLIRPISQKL